MNRTQKIRAVADGGLMLALAGILSIVTIFKMPFGGGVTLFSMLPIGIYAYRYRTPQALVVAVLFGIVEMIIGLKNFSYVSGIGSYVVVAIFDYILAFGVLGFSGMFKKVKRTPAIIIAAVLILCTVALFTVALLSSGDKDMIAELKSRWWIIALEAGVIVVLTIFALIFQKKATASSVTIATGLAVTGVLRFVCHFISGVTVWSEYAADKTAVMYSLYYNLSYMIPEIILSVLMAALISNLLNFDAETMDVIWKDDSQVKKLWDDEEPAQNDKAE
ncbi:MAG: energy-coupled thiamine transporter ThiT [Clostridia bacterium]|nr:energy-coupled thiamine transporter ThiT [Clostridia bacterium]